MIGSRVSCTIWHVHYRHKNVEPPLVRLTNNDPPPHIEGHLNVVTADPTGSDLCEVAAMVILGAKRSARYEFQIREAKHLDDVQGLALVAGGKES